MDWKEHIHHAVVVGLGASGTAAVRLLSALGIQVTGMDEGGDPARTKAALADLPCRIVSGAIDTELLCRADLVVVSPGVDQNRPEFVTARQKGIPVIGELELAFRELSLPIVAITGTNGKSTVTQLIADMLSASGKRVFAGGNLGDPLSSLALAPAAYDIAVVEVSSFQLDTITTFTPSVAVLLNITEDHLDRYDGFAGYCHAKAQLFSRMKGGVAVLNHRDTAVREIGAALPFSPLWYNTDDETGMQVTETGLLATDGTPVPLGELSLAGRHNRENTAAALLAAKAGGATDAGILTAIRNFKGLPHRMAYCGNIGEIPCYNDSKATNIDAVKRAVDAFGQPVVLIMGGRDKGGDYRTMRRTVSRYARAIILIGEATEKIRDAFADLTVCIPANTLETALAKALENARPDAAVILSPACSSFDMFQNYRERGDRFAAAVKLMAGKEGV